MQLSLEVLYRNPDSCGFDPVAVHLIIVPETCIESVIVTYCDITVTHDEKELSCTQTKGFLKLNVSPKISPICFHWKCFTCCFFYYYATNAVVELVLNSGIYTCIAVSL